MTDSEAAPRPELRDLLRANMFDGDEDGTVTMPVATLLDEVVDIVAEYAAIAEGLDDDD